MILVRTLVLLPIFTYFLYVLTVICPFYSDSSVVIPPDKPITSLACSLNHHISRPIYAATIKPQVDNHVVPALVQIDSRFGVSHLASEASRKALRSFQNYNSYVSLVFYTKIWPTMRAWTHVVEITISLNIHAFKITCRIALLRLERATSAYTTTIYKRLLFQAYKRPWTRQIMEWVWKSHDSSKSKLDFIRREWRRLAAYKDDTGFSHLALSKQQDKLSKDKRFSHNQLVLIESSLGTSQEIEVEHLSRSSISASDSHVSATNYGATPLPEPFEGEEDFEEEPLTVRVVETIYVRASDGEATHNKAFQSDHSSVSASSVAEMVSAIELESHHQIENADPSHAEISSVHPMIASITEDLQNWNTRINRTLDMAAGSIEREMNEFIGSIITNITEIISSEIRHVSERTQLQYAKMNRMIADINRDYGIMQTERDPDQSLADRQAMRDLIAFTKPLTDHTSHRVQDILTEKHSIVVDEYFKVIQRNIDTLEMFADVTAAEFSKALGSKLQWLEQEDPSQGPFVWKAWTELRQLHEQIFDFRDHLFDAASQYKNNKPSETSIETIGLDQWNDFLRKVELHLNLLVRENLEFLASVRARANLAYQAREQLAREIVADRKEQEKLEQEKSKPQELVLELELELELKVGETKTSDQNVSGKEAVDTKIPEKHAPKPESTTVESESDSDEEYDPTTVSIMHTVYVSHNSSNLGGKLFNQTLMSSGKPQIDLLNNDPELGSEDSDQTSDFVSGTDATDTE